MRRYAVGAVASGLLVVLATLCTATGSAKQVTAAVPIFRGNGGKTLTPFRVTRPSTLLWASSGAIFQIFPEGLGGGSVNSQAKKGATYLAPGRYTLQVNADGNWVIEVKPGVERPKRIAAGLVGFSGNGGRDLPPISLPRSEEVYWASGGAIFQIFDKQFSGAVEVNSQAKKGSTYASKGAHQLTVNADGNWKVAWKP